MVPEIIFGGVKIMTKKECKDMDTPVVETKKSCIKELIESGKVELFKVDDEGKVILDPNNPDHREWLEE